MKNLDNTERTIFLVAVILAGVLIALFAGLVALYLVSSAVTFTNIASGLQP
jgi:hypothetical protein